MEFFTELFGVINFERKQVMSQRKYVKSYRKDAYRLFHVSCVNYA